LRHPTVAGLQISGAKQLRREAEAPGLRVGEVGEANMTMLRLSRIALVATVAAFFTLVAFGNVTDYGANWQFVSHVMSMDTTYRNPDVMWRAVTDPTLQRVAYALIIAWQAATALVLWIGVARLLRTIGGDAIEFAESRAVAIAGLTMGLLLYAVGFLVVAGEWFAMWQSQTWNGQQAAGIFVLLIGLALLHLCGPEPERRT
jgi:predicted small integral membrane protein